MVYASSIQRQKERYNRQSDDYQRHHGDHYSQQYRTLKQRQALFNFDVKGKKVLEAMCGPGVETEFLLSKECSVVGLDISERNAQLYTKHWDLPCEVCSINETTFEDNVFDVVYIFGGLHHIIPYLKETFHEIHRILKPGGQLCFVEPNADSALDYLRKLWYKLDNRFEKEERALSYKKDLLPFLKFGFEEKLYKSGGNFAYLLIAQSFILKTPKFIKKMIFKPALAVESLLEFLPWTNLFFVARWQKSIDG